MQTEFEALDEATSAVIDELNKDRAKLAAEALQMRQERDEAIAALRELVATFNPDEQAIYEFARKRIEAAGAIIAKAEGGR